MKWLEVEHVSKERITLVPRLGNVWVPVDSNVKHYCTQFYRPELDSRIKEGDCILKIACTRGEFHMLCWVFSTYLYGRLNWRYIGRNDLNYNIKIGNNWLQFVASKEPKDETTL